MQALWSDPAAHEGSRIVGWGGNCVTHVWIVEHHRAKLIVNHISTALSTPAVRLRQYLVEEIAGSTAGSGTLTPMRAVSTQNENEQAVLEGSRQRVAALLVSYHSTPLMEAEA